MDHVGMDHSTTDDTAHAALIVGAGPRLGAAIARSLADDQRPIGLVGRSEQSTGTLRDMLRAEGIEAYAAAADVTDASGLTAAIRQLEDATGAFDVAVHNVSAWRDAGAVGLTAGDLLADVAVGTASLMTIVNAVAPGMIKRGRGTILATGSGAADGPTPGAPSLAVQKAGLRILVRGLAAELAPKQVHCASVTILGGLGDPGFDVADIAPVYRDLVIESENPSEAWRTIVEFTGAL